MKALPVRHVDSLPRHDNEATQVSLSFSHRIYDRFSRAIAPTVRPSQLAYHERLSAELREGFDWLDLGCGHQILPPWVKADEPELVRRCRSVVGVDLDLDSLRKNQVFLGRVAKANLTQIPFKDGSFDLVTANMVVEHLSEPQRVLEEVRRVLRPGGRFIYHTPNRKAPAIRLANHTPETLKKRLVWLLERREEADIFKTYYRMNTAEDVSELATLSGLKVRGILELSSSAITYRLGPLALPELVFLRILEHERFRHLRTNLIVTLEK